MINFQEGDLMVGNVKLHYYQHKNKMPDLLFVHGFTDNGLYWTRTMQALETAYNITTYDARGHGSSSRASGHFSEEDRVKDLLGIVDGLKLNRPGLFGHSMGGATIAQAAATKPNLPRFLVLEDPAWWEPNPNSAEELIEMKQKHQVKLKDWRDWLVTIQTASRDTALTRINTESPLWSKQDAELSLNARLQFENGLLDLFPPERMPWREIIPKINCPFLLIVGENDLGGILTPDIAEEAVGLSKNGSWVKIKNAGHSIRYDQFEAYYKVVKEFLLKVDGG